MRPDVSSGPFHVRYFEINIGDFFFTTVLYIFLTKASFSNLLFKENFSERQRCLGNCFLGSRNAGNGVSEYSITAPRKHSRPVLSEVCPLLYKTVENPALSNIKL